MRFFWYGVVTNTAKAGAIVKDIDSDIEVLVRWKTPTLVDIEPSTDTGYIDESSPWVENAEEKALVIIGMPVTMWTDSKSYPSDGNQVIAANLQPRMRFEGEAMDLVVPGDVIIIYHDFSEELAKGNSGSTMAGALREYYQSSLGFKVHLIQADKSYDLTMAKLFLLKAHKIDRIIILTHGSPAQLWLGDPEKPKMEDTVALDDRKEFVNSGIFGGGLRELFGEGLAMCICSCHLACEDGMLMLIEMMTAMKPRAIYAATGEVFFHPLAGKSNAIVEKGDVLVFRPRADIYPLSGKMKSKFPLFTM